MEDYFYGCLADNISKWSRDWENFNWEAVREKIERAEEELKQGVGNKEEYDIGITAEQFVEFLQWFQENAPEEYNRFVVYMILREKGLEEQEITFCLSHPEELKQALELLQRENKME